MTFGCVRSTETGDRQGYAHQMSRRPQHDKDIGVQAVKVNLPSRARSWPVKDTILVAATVHKHVVPPPVVDKTVRRKPSTSKVAAIVKSIDNCGQAVPKASASSAVTRTETARTQRGIVIDPKYHDGGAVRLQPIGTKGHVTSANPLLIPMQIQWTLSSTLSTLKEEL